MFAKAAAKENLLRALIKIKINLIEQYCKKILNPENAQNYKTNLTKVKREDADRS